MICIPNHKTKQSKVNYLQPVLYYLLPQFINTVEPAPAKIAFLLVDFCSRVHISGLKRGACLCLVFNRLVQVAGAKTN